MKELAEASNNRRCFFRPDGKMRRDYFRKGWDVVQVLLLTYVALVVPYRTGFGLIICHKYTPFAFWFEVFVDVYFILDIVINFRTAFWDVNQELIIEPKAICFEYLKTCFFIDLAACFPITYIELLVSPSVQHDDNNEPVNWDPEEPCGSGQAGGKFKLLKIIRLLRLAKVRPPELSWAV